MHIDNTAHSTWNFWNENAFYRHTIVIMMMLQWQSLLSLFLGFPQRDFVCISICTFFHWIQNFFVGSSWLLTKSFKLGTHMGCLDKHLWYIIDYMGSIGQLKAYTNKDNVIRYQSIVGGKEAFWFALEVHGQETKIYKKLWNVSHCFDHIQNQSWLLKFEMNKMMVSQWKSSSSKTPGSKATSRNICTATWRGNRNRGNNNMDDMEVILSSLTPRKKHNKETSNMWIKIKHSEKTVHAKSKRYVRRLIALSLWNDIWYKELH